MEEAPVVVTAATGSLGPVVAKLSTLLRRHGDYKLRRGTRKDVKLIRSKLKNVHSILWEIWKRVDVDAEGKKLRVKAWRLADDMNDAIDDFIISMKRSNNDFKQSKIQPSPFQDLKRRADDVSEQCQNKWKMEVAQTNTCSSLFSTRKATANDSGLGNKRPRINHPYVHKDISKLVGMEKPRDKLIKHLVGDEDSTPQAQLKMACILGAAGMGKTTLARLVYEAIEDKFEARAFVSITSCQNMTEVLASIYQQVQRLDDSTTVVPLAGTKAVTAKEHLIDVISKFLKNKRYLVIIDDIWHCGEWETIKKSLPDNNRSSRLIVTTSLVNKSISDKCRDDFDALVHKIDHSGEWNDFTRKMIDMNADMVGEDFDHGHHIVKMCRGMPLAVACMALSLAKERERQEQQEGLCVLNTPGLQDRIEEQVKQNGIQNTPGFEALVESLELGYKDLPHHMLKTCFLYISIYPENYEIKRDDLVRRWIAEGFVCKQELAEDYFDELVSRGLFQEFGLVSRIAIKAEHFELHPMMRNYLRQKLREDNFITCTSDGVPSSLVGRLVIDDYWPGSDSVDPLSGIHWHHIRSLAVFKDAEKVPYKDLQNLRVLDIQYNQKLENQHLKDMCGLLRLRHLFVTGDFGVDWDAEVVRLLESRSRYPVNNPVRISEIPRDIKRLKYLETLEVIGTRIRRLPAEIGDLKQLKTLNVIWNSQLVELPREMGNLQHILENLRICKTGIREQACWEIIGTLKKLKTLDVSSNDYLSGIPRDIGELQQLKNLDASRNYRITELPKEIGKLQRLETLDMSATGIKEVPKEIGKLQHMQTLNLSNTKIIKLPSEIGNLQHLETLNLRDTLITELPMEIGNLQQLKVLDLTRVVRITKLPRGIGKLQLLEELYLRGTKVRKLPREIGGLKNLKNVSADISTLPFEAWKNSDLLSSLADELLSFSEAGGDGRLVVGTKHMHVPQWIKEHFNSIGYLDIRMCKLEEQDQKILREMPCLRRLRLRFEVVPREPISIRGGGFAKLVALTVDSRVPRITFQEGAMPSLSGLALEFQFYGGPPNLSSMGIKHLVSLNRVRFLCSEWYLSGVVKGSPCMGDMIDDVINEASEHPNKETFEFTLSPIRHESFLFERQQRDEDLDTIFFPEDCLITRGRCLLRH